MCPDGYTGQSSTKCIPFECNTNQDCDFDKKCVEGSCKNPCLERHACGVNAQCRSENHEANCVCLQNYVGDAKVLCEESKVALCQSNSCGINAMCRVDSDKTIGCYCPPLYPNGDPKKECKSLEILIKFFLLSFQIESIKCVHQMILHKRFMFTNIR